MSIPIFILKALRTPVVPTTRVTLGRMATSAATAGLVRVSLVIPTDHSPRISDTHNRIAFVNIDGDVDYNSKQYSYGITSLSGHLPTTATSTTVRVL